MKEKKKSGIVSLGIMLLLTIATQVISISKSSIVASAFGASAELDAFSFANSIVTFIFGFFGSAVTTVIIPAYISKKNKKQINSFITLIYMTIAVIALAAALFRFQIIAGISNRDSYFVSLAGNILLWLLGANFIFAITHITAAHFQCEEKFNIPKIILFISQLIVICFLVCSKGLDISRYTVIFCVGLLIAATFDAIAAYKTGWSFYPNFCFWDEEVSRLLKMFFPVVLSAGVYKLSLMVDSAISSRLEEGMVTILSYSSQIADMVNSVLIGNLLVYCYPKIVKNIHAPNGKQLFWQQAAFFHLVVMLVITGFACVGREGISLLFGHGKFGPIAVNRVFLGTLIYVIGQQTNIVRDLIYRYFYANGDTKTAASNSILVSAVNISASIILVKLIGFYGIILGTVVASLVSLIRILYKFQIKFGFGVPILNIFFRLLKNIAICVMTITFVFITKGILHINGNLLSILIYGIEAVLVFVALSCIVNRDTIKIIKTI